MHVGCLFLFACVCVCVCVCVCARVHDTVVDRKWGEAQGAEGFRDWPVALGAWEGLHGEQDIRLRGGHEWCLLALAASSSEPDLSLPHLCARKLVRDA